MSYSAIAFLLVASKDQTNGFLMSDCDMWWFTNGELPRKAGEGPVFMLFTQMFSWVLGDMFYEWDVWLRVLWLSTEDPYKASHYFFLRSEKQ